MPRKEAHSYISIRSCLRLTTAVATGYLRACYSHPKPPSLLSSNFPRALARKYSPEEHIPVNWFAARKRVLPERTFSLTAKAISVCGEIMVQVLDQRGAQRFGRAHSRCASAHLTAHTIHRASVIAASERIAY